MEQSIHTTHTVIDGYEGILTGDTDIFVDIADAYNVEDVDIDWGQHGIEKEQTEIMVNRLINDTNDFSGDTFVLTIVCLCCQLI